MKYPNPIYTCTPVQHSGCQDGGGGGRGRRGLKEPYYSVMAADRTKTRGVP